MNDLPQNGIAIIGMSGRFPGAETITQFWENICNGTDSLTFFTDEELAQSGVREELIKNPSYVKGGGVLRNVEFFDADFFGMTPREARLTDPQHRLFLECAWEALEDAGYDPHRYEKPIGVFAGCGPNGYLINHIIPSIDAKSTASGYQVMIGNNGDYLSTRVSYKFNLHGPSLDIQTACSTSLVAIHTACINLLTYQCEMAIAGGASLRFPHNTGYLYEEGHILSPDGICRPFCEKANGTVWGEGAGVLVLKRLEDALEDHDSIYAVLCGSAVNNDGSRKVGYTAPSIDGQLTVITTAQAFNDTDPQTIEYIEAHGTGTPLGDPIEIAALTKVFQRNDTRTGYCAIGSVKSNIGHLDAAAGVAGVIKAALAIKHRCIPPSIHFEKPNPAFNIEKTPFYIPTHLQSWPQRDWPRRAGVSSFGIGGTNAHAVLQEVVQPSDRITSRKMHLLPLSAQSENALQDYTTKLKIFLEQSTACCADIAYTLQNGRKEFDYRSVIICTGTKNGADVVTSKTAGKFVTGKVVKDNPEIVFMFTGQGAQYPGMGYSLYMNEPVFKKQFDECMHILQSHGMPDLKSGIFNTAGTEALVRTEFAQPALFTLEYATATHLMNMGVKPAMMIGHSIGELTAACIAGVFSLEDALRLVTIRGRLMGSMPEGAMLSVSLPYTEVIPYTNETVVCAAVNAPELSVLSGPPDQLSDIEKRLSEKKVTTRRLHTSHAFHSPSMQPAADAFGNEIAKTRLSPPVIPIISNVSGKLLTEAEATSSVYWASHLRSCVNFSGGVKYICSSSNNPIFIETGPGTTLCSLTRTHSEVRNQPIATIPHASDTTDGDLFFSGALGKLWIAGISLQWKAMYETEERFRISLPTYPFQKSRFWIDPPHRNELFSSQSSDEDIEEQVKSSATTQITNEIPSVATYWKELLGIELLQPDDNFFSLGGDSLLCVQLLSRIKKDHSCSLTIQDLQKSPTLKDMIVLVENASTAADTEKPIPSGLTGKTHQPLSSPQRRLWYLYRFEPASPSYNIVQAFEIYGTVDHNLIQKAIRSVAERQESLRTVFREEHGVPYAEVTDIPDYPVKVLHENHQDLIFEEIRKPFVLETGPLMRIIIIKGDSAPERLLFVMHHIISDGWSMGVFAKELVTLYGADNAVKETQPLPLQYADYAYWLNNRMESEKQTNNHITFWKKHLEGDLPVLEMPSDFSRPQELNFHGSLVSFTLQDEITGRLKKIANEKNTTLFTILLGAYSVLLSRYSGQSKLVIGTPLANRNRIDIENIIGFFLNMLPVRITLEPKKTFDEHIEALSHTVSECMAHSNISFEQIVESVKPVRDVSHAPMFQTMFAFQNFPLPAFNNDQISLKPVFYNRGITQYEISLYMWEKDGHLQGSFEFSTELFLPETVRKIAEHFQVLLAAIAENKHLQISTLPLLTAEDKQRILYDWNDTDAELPETCLHSLIKKQAASTPDAIAITAGSDDITYSQLIAQADRITSVLLNANVGAGSFIGIMTSRSSTMIAAIIAVHSIGAAYVPLDPNYPQERLSYMIEDANIRFVLTEKPFDKNLPADTVTPVLIDSLTETLTILPDIAPVSAESAAYVIYTSGSTGKPKGVVIPHRAVVNFLLGMQKMPGIHTTDVMLAVTTLSFDISVLELFLPLVSGARVVIADHATATNGTQLKELLEKSSPTILQATPSTWRLLLSSGWKGSPVLKALCGGEAFPTDLASALFPIVKELWNMYGPTETTVWSTCFKITNPNEPICIGRPIQNTRIYILDSFMQPLPSGVPGNLFIAGDSLATGYHGKPELTSAVFTQKIFTGNDNNRMYRTGDIARYTHNGTIEYLRRADTQVKVRGFRIELGDVEAALSLHSAIQQCVAACHEQTPGDMRLVAYYILKSDQFITTTELRKHLISKLPAYMIPQHFMEIDKLPLTPAGKVDRKRLPSPFNHETKSIATKKLPQTPAEKFLAQVWSQFLKTDTIYASDNFFEIGGHSLLSMQVIAHVQKETGIEIHPREMMLNTLKQIAEHIPVSNPGEDLPQKSRKQSLWNKLGMVFGKKGN